MDLESTTEDVTMEIGMVGLGKMGANMAQRLLADDHNVVVYDRNPEAVDAAADAGAIPTGSPEDLVSRLAAPRAVWVMVPSGDPTEQTVTGLSELLEHDDVIIDGGNSNYKDAVRRAETLANQQGLYFVDVGTSGGIWGVTEGYSMMVGGKEEVVGRLRPIFETLAPAPDRGWGHVGPSGSGHFVKMVHNGIEYGLMQAYAEGFELMGQKAEFGLDLHQISEIWRDGSVVRSWLLDLAASALAEDATLEKVSTYVADSGEGRWTVAEAIELGCAIPVITAALQQRFRSQVVESFGDKLLSALRNQFGGHELERRL
jgi:6-phosphogluconate dehydrogenase